jgi:hypothetical protein
VSFRGRILAVGLALVITGVVIVLTTDAPLYFTAWLNSLSRTQLIVLRTLVLFVPVLLAIVAAAARRRRPPDE